MKIFAQLPRIKNNPLLIWLIVRLSTIIVAALAFVYEQSTRLRLSDAGHRQFEGFPYDPGQSAPGLLGRLLVAPWYNYDAVYYVQIASSGYKPGEITLGFHPLYPWIAGLLTLLTREPLVSLMIVSSVAGLLLSIIFYRLARLDYDQTTSRNATALLLCWPPAIAIFLPYTEALFLLLAVCCLFAARRRQFWLSGLAGGLAAMTRQHGILLTLPLAWEIWEGADRDWRKLAGFWRSVPTILFPAAGYAAWIIYRAIAINDVRPDFSSLQSFIFSVMVSPTAHTIYQEQYFMWPWQALWRAIQVLWSGESHWTAWGDVTLAATFVALLIFSWRKMRTSYRIYSVAVVLLALSLHTGVINPYISLPRRLVPAFPVFIAVAAHYKFKRPAFVFGSLAVCQALLLCCYVWEVWVP
jgi:Gpi18-like mannosyltransferase